ncbi:MAG: hypothetical protein V7752_18840 [Halopseudomonas sp.]
MNKKIVYSLITLALSAPVHSAEAERVKVGFGFDMGLGITAQINDQVNVSIGNDGIAADYLVKKGRFDTNVPYTWYVGAGAFVGWDEDYGLRVPFGADWNFEKRWNAFGQISPDIDFDGSAKFGLSAALGVRYSF